MITSPTQYRRRHALTMIYGTSGFDIYMLFGCVFMFATPTIQVEQCNKEFGELASCPAAAEVEAKLGPAFKTAYATIFDNVLASCKGVLLKLVAGDADYQAPQALPEAVDFFGQVNEWHAEAWATSSHKEEYIVLSRLLTGLSKFKYLDSSAGSAIEELFGGIRDINLIADMGVDTILSILPPGDDADRDAGAIRGFIVTQCSSESATSSVQKVSGTIATVVAEIKAKFSEIDLSKVEFHTSATDEALMGKLADLRGIDSKAFADITDLGTKIADAALVAQSRCLEASLSFLAESASLARFVASCGDSRDARDKMAIDDAKVKLVKDVRSAIAVLEAAMKPHGDLLDTYLQGKVRWLHVPAFDATLGSQAGATLKRLLASCRTVVKKVVDQWVLDLKDLGDALGKFCPAWQGRDAELLLNKALQNMFLSNPHYAKITPTVELMKKSIKLLKARALNLKRAPNLESNSNNQVLVVVVIVLLLLLLLVVVVLRLLLHGVLRFRLRVPLVLARGAREVRSSNNKDNTNSNSSSNNSN